MAKILVEIDTDLAGAETVVRRMLHGLSEEFTDGLLRGDGERAAIDATVDNDGVREALYADDITV